MWNVKYKFIQKSTADCHIHVLQKGDETHCVDLLLRDSDILHFPYRKKF